MLLSIPPRPRDYDFALGFSILFSPLDKMFLLV